MEIGNPAPQPLRLLVCDDSSMERFFVAHLLRDEGFEVDEAGDGASAIRHLRRCRVDGLLLDLEMPRVNGFGVLRYLQSHHPALPVVLLSGMPAHLIQRQLQVFGARELPPLLIKPIEPDHLLRVVQWQFRALILRREPYTGYNAHVG